MTEHEKSDRNVEPTGPHRVFRDNKPYGDALRDVMASGDVNDIRRAHAFARSWLDTAEKELAEVRHALQRLDGAMAELDC